MNVLDYVILALAAVSVIHGIFKGFIRQVLVIVGIIVVAMLTATVQPYIQSWLTNLIPDDSKRAVVAMILSVILLIVAYAILASLIHRILKNITILNVVDKVLGGLIGVAVVYFVFAIFFALLLETDEAFMPAFKLLLGDSVQNSWIANKVYSNNFFGSFIVKDIAERILNSLQPAA